MGSPGLTATLTVRSDQLKERCASRRPATRTPAGIDAIAPLTIALMVMRVIPVLTEATAASFIIPIFVFIDDDDHIHQLTPKF